MSTSNGEMHAVAAVVIVTIICTTSNVSVDELCSHENLSSSTVTWRCLLFIVNWNK